MCVAMCCNMRISLYAGKSSVSSFEMCQQMRGSLCGARVAAGRVRECWGLLPRSIPWVGVVAQAFVITPLKRMQTQRSALAACPMLHFGLPYFMPKNT